MDAETRASVLDLARSWIDTPYQHKARVKGVGVDCGQLLHAVYGEFFPLQPMPQDYAPDWTLHEGTGEIYLDFIKDYTVEVRAPVVAGIVVFKIGLRYGHAGIVSDKGVIHAWGRTRYGSVQEKPWAFFRKHQRKYFDVRY